MLRYKPLVLAIYLFTAGVFGSASIQAQEAPDEPGEPRTREARPRRSGADRPRDAREDDRAGPRDPLFPPGKRPEKLPLPPGPPDVVRPRRPDGLFPPDRFRGVGDPDQLRRVDPEMAKLIEADRDFNRHAAEIAERYRRAPRDQREALRTELTNTVGQHFEARQKRRELELKRLAEQLERLREEIKKRQDARQQLIDRRVSELVGEDRTLDF